MSSCWWMGPRGVAEEKLGADQAEELAGDAALARAVLAGELHHERAPPVFCGRLLQCPRHVLHELAPAELEHEEHLVVLRAYLAGEDLVHPLSAEALSLRPAQAEGVLHLQDLLLEADRYEVGVRHEGADGPRRHAWRPGGEEGLLPGVLEARVLGGGVRTRAPEG